MNETLKRRLLGVFWWVVAGLCLVWVFHDVNLPELGAQLGRMDWRWIGLAVLFDTISYYVQGARWSLLLRPLGRVSSISATQAVYAGLFTNEIVPLRAGEAVRAFLVSRWVKKPFVDVLPSMAVERLIDAVWLVAATGIAALVVDLPRELSVGADILGVAALVLAVLFIVIALRGARPRSKPPAGPVGRFAQRMIGGVAAIGISPRLGISAAGSVLILVFQALSFWCCMKGYHIPLTPLQGGIVFIIVHLGTAIPNAPSNVGSFQLFTVLGLNLFGITGTTASGFSMVVFILLTLPLWLIGFFALSMCGHSLASVRSALSSGAIPRETGKSPGDDPL